MFRIIFLTYMKTIGTLFVSRMYNSLSTGNENLNDRMMNYQFKMNLRRRTIDTQLTVRYSKRNN